MQIFGFKGYGITSVRAQGWERVMQGKVMIMDLYSSQPWKAKRKKILRRDEYLCQWCKRYGRRVDATTVHHIEHYEDRPDLALVDSNLISLCDKCHNKAHPEKGGKRHRTRRNMRY